MTLPSLARFKVCTKCGCTKPANTAFFGVHRDAYLGLRPTCRACRSVESKSSEGRRKDKAMYWKHQESISARHKRYYQRNAERLRAYSRQWAQENPEKARITTKQWVSANYERVLASQRKRRARKAAVGSEPYTAVDLNDMWHDQRGACYYCQTPLFAHYHIEHKQPISRGGPDALWNLCLACPPCNHRKHAKTEAEFMALLAQEEVTDGARTNIEENDHSGQAS